MKAEQRRARIAQTLTADHPISATALARRFAVSRQIIVGDIALLRAGGMDIVATPRGYKLGETSGLVRAVACLHTAEQTEAELLAMVDNGCTVVDVVVEHPLYGQLTGQLSLALPVRRGAVRGQDPGQRPPLRPHREGSTSTTCAAPTRRPTSGWCRALEGLGILYTQGNGGGICGKGLTSFH